MADLTDADLALIRSVQLLSVKELAERAGLAESSIRTYRTRGQVPAPDVTIGGTPGWLATTVDPWIATLPGRGARTDLIEQHVFKANPAGNGYCIEGLHRGRGGVSCGKPSDHQVHAVDIAAFEPGFAAATGLAGIHVVLDADGALLVETIRDASGDAER